MDFKYTVISNLLDVHLGNVLTINSKEIVKYSCL